MKSDAPLSRTCHRKRSAVGLFVLAILLANLLYSTLAFAQILGTGQLNIERRSHTATLLENGRVLIIGGDNQNGVLSQAEIFDPVSRTSTLAAASLTPRTDHTANRLSDGRVLVIGGRDQSVSLDSTEIYNPLTSSFVDGPSMMRARSGHTATALSNGKILVTGGDLFGSAEIYDPVMQSFSLVTGSLNTPRKFHSAVLLHNGQVMIVGGVDAQNTVLNTAEVFDPASQSFYLPATDMQAARAFATLKLLPDGKVQIIGGDAEFSMEVFDPADGIFIAKALLPPNAHLLGATLSTQSRAALFSPSISHDALLQGVLTSEQLALLDRADQSITELPSRNEALVAGGLNSTGQVLNSAKLVSSSRASVTTDKTDYAPGQIVTISGSGFQPNEQVDIYFHEFPEAYPDVFLSAVANQQGNFVVAEFAPQQIDLGRIFTLTAFGQSSGFAAQTAFKDSTNVDAATITMKKSDCTTNPTTANTFTRGDVICASVQVTATSGSGSGNNFFIQWFDASSPTPVLVQTATKQAPSSSTVLPVTFTDTYTTTASSPIGTWTVKVCKNTGCSGGNFVKSQNFTLRTTPVITWSNPDDITYGTALSGTQLNATANVPGTFVYTPSAGTLFNAGNNQILHVDFTPTDTNTYNTASKDVLLNVLKKDATWTTNAASKMYSDPDPVPLTTGSGTGFLPSDGVTATYSRAAGENASPPIYHITATLSSTVSGALNNYTISNNGAEFTIKKRKITVTADAQSKFYGDADPTLTYKITSGSLKSGDSITGALTRAAGENAGTYAISQGTLVISDGNDGNNYDLAFVGANLTINKRAITIAVDAKSKTYGDDDPALTYKISAGSLKSGDTITGALTRDSGEKVGSYAIMQGTLVISDGNDGNNYDLAFVGANLTINKRAITIAVEAKSKTYGDADPVLTYKITSGSLAFSDSFTGALTRMAGENVGSYAILQGTLALSSNYYLTFVGANLTITARPITVTADAKTKTKGASDPMLTYQISDGSLAFSDYFTGALTRDLGEGVGSYAIKQGTLSINNIDNYYLTFIRADFHITYGVCLLFDNSKAVQKNATIPIKLNLCDINGVNVSSSAVVLNATKLVWSGVETAPEVQDSGNANPDDNFRFTGGSYLFNLSTKNLWSGKWGLEFKANGDSLSHVVIFNVK